MKAATLDELKGAFVAASAATGAKEKMVFLAENTEVILVTKADDAANTVNVWYLKGGADATTANDDTIVLLGSVSNDGSTEVKLTTDDFTAF